MHTQRLSEAEPGSCLSERLSEESRTIEGESICITMNGLMIVLDNCLRCSGLEWIEGRSSSGRDLMVDVEREPLILRSAQKGMYLRI